MTLHLDQSIPELSMESTDLSPWEAFIGRSKPLPESQAQTAPSVALLPAAEEQEDREDSEALQVLEVPEAQEAQGRHPEPVDPFDLSADPGTPCPEWRDEEPDPQTLRAECMIADIMAWKLGPAERPFPGEQPSPAAVPAVIRVTQVKTVTPVNARKKLVKSERLPAPIDAEEVSYMALCSPKHIYDLGKQPGAIPHSRRRRRITFDRAEIQAWLDGFKVA